VAAGHTPPQNTCPTGEVCAAAQRVADPTFHFPACTTAYTFPLYTNGPGACVAACIANGDPNAIYLGQSTCATGEKCAPCINPTTKVSTGACD
jgi:hypothetical protein